MQKTVDAEIDLEEKDWNSHPHGGDVSIIRHLGHPHA